ncbi:MAG: GGDEF domain-containing protein [Sandaracinaceae bacterium]
MRTAHTFQRLRLAMLALGGTVGLAFPSIAYFGFGVDTAETISFHILCIVTGLLVGALNYALFYGVVDRKMSEIALRMEEHAVAYARGEEVAPPSRQALSEDDDALGKMTRAFSDLALVVSGQLAMQRFAAQVVDALSETVELDQTCEALLQQLRASCGASRGVVYVRTPRGFERHASLGIDLTDAPMLLSPDSALVKSASEGPCSLLVEDTLHWLKPPTLLGVILPRLVHTFPIEVDGEPVALVTCTYETDTPEDLDVRLSLIQREAGVHIANARLHHQLSDLAAIDELTGLLNRRFGLRRLREAHSQSSRTGDGVGVVLFDIDHFKRFNDIHGHAAGDVVLKAVADTLSDTVREYDSVVRWGGEELLLIAPELSTTAVTRCADRLRAAVAAMEVDWHGTLLKVTVSAGASSSSDPNVSVEALVAQADTALYAAKNAGRNRVAAHCEPKPECHVPLVGVANLVR